MVPHSLVVLCDRSCAVGSERTSGRPLNFVFAVCSAGTVVKDTAHRFPSSSTWAQCDGIARRPCNGLVFTWFATFAQVPEQVGQGRPLSCVHGVREGDVVVFFLTKCRDSRFDILL